MKKFLQKSKKTFYNQKIKKIFYNNLGICRVIIFFTVCLCITKNEKLSALFHELYSSVQYFF